MTSSTAASEITAISIKPEDFKENPPPTPGLLVDKKVKT